MADSLKMVRNYMSSWNFAQLKKFIENNVAFAQAFESDIGKELLKDDVDRLWVLLALIYTGKATPEQGIEFQYLKHRVDTVSERIVKFYGAMTEWTSRTERKP